MARNISERLSRLKQRRSGTDRLDRLTEDAMGTVLAKSLYDEPWQKRVATTQPNTRYVVGAMTAVDPDYTRISIDTAVRVGNQLKVGLAAAGFSVDFRLQGSVPLDVHIRGVSDVDLLNLHLGILVYDRNGPRANTYLPASQTSLAALQELRREAEKILKAKFPAATVDTAGGKAIGVSGGSLARPVDVVPSMWWDTSDYQTTYQEHDRGVTILNKRVPETLHNQPFRHIKRVNDSDVLAHGGLKKSIRLCKHVKNDASEEGTAIELPSFDIAAVMYHANLGALAANRYHELAVLAETQRHLDALACNHEQAKQLWVPDGSRKIFDTTAKLTALNRLSSEMDDLLAEVAREQAPMLGSMRSSYDSRNILTKSIIPAG